MKEMRDVDDMLSSQIFFINVSCVSKQHLVETVSTHSNVSRQFFVNILSNVSEVDLCRPYDSVTEASFLANQRNISEA